VKFDPINPFLEKGKIMAKQEKKDGIFKKTVEALSSRDEKETIAKLEAELAKAQKEAEQAKKTVSSLIDRTAEVTKDNTDAEAKVKQAEKRIAELEAKLKMKMEKNPKRGASKPGDLEKRMASKKPAIITVHTVESNNQTLSHVALKYYKHATPPYWKYLLEHNMQVLNGSEKNIRMGMKLEIPELPDELKD
jgi:septal ring factor EnvC (AmiA/AmiB activator)